MVDLDDLFAYKSVRVAKIRNRWLGILHFTFMFLIFFYIVICNLILKKGWLEDHEPVSSLRLQLKSPTDVDLDRHANATHMPKYCGAGGKQCVWWNERQLVYPAVENNSMLVTTRVTIETMTRPATCVAPLTKECMWKMGSSASSAGPAAPAAKPPPLYPVEPERCTLLIQHHTSLRVGSTYIRGGGKGAGMKGKLIDQNGKTINPCDDYLPGQCPTKPEYKFDVSFGKPQIRDIIPIQTILRAAGTNLQNNLEELSGKVITKRNAGMVIICELQYTNKDGGIFDFSPTAVSYEMSCNHVPKADFKVYEKVSQTVHAQALQPARHPAPDPTDRPAGRLLLPAHAAHTRRLHRSDRRVDNDRGLHHDEYPQAEGGVQKPQDRHVARLLRLGS